MDPDQALQLAHSHALSRGFRTVAAHTVECITCRLRVDPLDTKLVDGHYFQHKYEDAARLAFPFMYLVVKGNTVTLVSYGQGTFEYTYPDGDATIAHVLVADKAIRDGKTIEEVKATLEQPK